MNIVKSTVAWNVCYICLYWCNCTRKSCITVEIVTSEALQFLLQPIFCLSISYFFIEWYYDNSEIPGGKKEEKILRSRKLFQLSHQQILNAFSLFLFPKKKLKIKKKCCTHNLLSFIMFVHIFFSGYALTSNNIPFWVVSGNHFWPFDHHANHVYYFKT